MLALFWGATIVSPAFISDCFYQSSQSLLFMQLLQLPLFAPCAQRVIVQICRWTGLPYPRSLLRPTLYDHRSSTARERHHVETQRFVLDTRLIRRVSEITWDHTLLSQAVALRPAPRGGWPGITHVIEDILSEIGRTYNGNNVNAILTTPHLAPSDRRPLHVHRWYHAHQLAFASSAIPDLLHEARSEWAESRRAANSVLLSILHVLPKGNIHPGDGLETIISGSLVAQSLAKLHIGGIAPAEAFCKLVGVLYGLDGWRGDIRLSRLTFEGTCEGVLGNCVFDRRRR